MMKRNPLNHKLSVSWSSLSVLQVLSLLVVGIFAFSLFVPVLEIEADKKGKVVANFVGGIGLIAGGVALLASAPAVVTVSTVVSFGCLCYTAGYYITDKVLSSS